MAPYPSGKGEVCKTFMHRFESDRRLFFPSSIYSWSAIGGILVLAALVRDYSNKTASIAIRRPAACSAIDLRSKSVLVVRPKSGAEDSSETLPVSLQGITSPDERHDESTDRRLKYSTVSSRA